MSDPSEPQRFSTPSPLPVAAATTTDAAGTFPLPSTATASDYPFEPLTNLSAVSSRMDTLQRFLSDSINRNVLLGETQMQFVSTEISSAIHEVIVNGAALLASSPFYLTPTPNLPSPTNRNPNSCNRPPEIPNPNTSRHPADFWNLTAGRIPNEWVEDPKPEPVDLEPDEIGGSNKINDDGGYDVVEVDAVELLAEHVHFCEFCGKGFKRDANLRMHMRAHGEQFKRPEALVKPPPPVSTSSSSGLAESANGGGSSTNTRNMRFSCPFVGCNRNKGHKKFRPLKSVICVRNHFKRTHCPKMYSCTRCNKKKFSVLGDLKNHMKNCGKSKWKCSCGTTFSRKDKLFGHISLFEGHMPAIDDGGADCNDEKLKNSEVSIEEEPEEDEEEFEAELGMMEEEVGGSVIANNKSGLDNNSVFEALDSMDDRSLQEMWGSCSPEFYQQFCNF